MGKLAGLIILMAVSHALAEEDYSVCGLPSVSGRIVGGEDALEGKWPWQASLQHEGRHFCGGSLIAPQWLLSAGHCFQGIPLDIIPTVDVYLGINQLGVNTSNTLVVKIKNIYIHPSYLSFVDPGDIAVVQLASPVTYTKYIRPICLPSHFSETFPCGMECWVIGWGATSYAGPPPENGTLQEVMTPLIDHETCDYMYRIDGGLDFFPVIARKEMVCSGYKDGHKGPCQGDSGGPLMCKVDGFWYQVGIVSWGIGCAEADFPGVFTLVTAYENWINAPTGDQVVFKNVTNIPPATKPCGGYLYSPSTSTVSTPRGTHPGGHTNTTTTTTTTRPTTSRANHVMTTAQSTHKTTIRPGNEVSTTPMDNGATTIGMGFGGSCWFWLLTVVAALFQARL